VTICGSVLQNSLQHDLPADFLRLFPSAHDLAYGAVTEVANLAQPLKQEVKSAFAHSLRRVWITLLALSCLGLISSFPMKALPLHTDLDGRWGVDSQTGGMTLDNARAKEEKGGE
jgi:hypothetical protein